MERYIINHMTQRIHDRNHLTERCNTDQILIRSETSQEEIFELEAKGYHRCYWCKFYA